jgi:integrase/recombinase XerD
MRLSGTAGREKSYGRPAATPAAAQHFGLRSGRMRAQCPGMRTFTDLPSVPSHSLASFTDQLRLAAYLARFQGSSGITPSPICAATWPGALNAAWTRSLRGARIWSCTSGGCRKFAGSMRVCGKGTKVVLIPLPPAVGRAIDRAIGTRTCGPILLNSRSVRMDRHAATRRLRHLAGAAGVRIARPHPHMLRHTFVTTMLDAGVDLRDVQIAARHADPRTTRRYDRARKNLDRHPNYILAAYIASGT